MPIVALRGYDGYGANDPILPVPPIAPTGPIMVPPPGGSPGFDPVIVLPPKAPMPPLTALLWLASLSAVGYIFWATLQPKSRRLVT